MKKGFSLVELLISLIVISCITAAFTPLITKKFSSGVFGGGGTGDLTTDCTDKFGDFCTLCTSAGCIDCGISCPDGEYMDTKNCICLPCKDKYGEDCEKCTEKKCLTCPSGQYLDSDENCQSCSSKFSHCASCTESECSACADGYVLTNPTSSTPCSSFSCSSPDFIQIGNLCITKKNIGDGTSLTIPSGVNVVNVNQTCNSGSSNKCCWKGATSGTNCDNANGGAYSGCNRTVCDWNAADYICKNFTAGGRTWRLATSSEMSNWGANSVGLGVNGLQLCDANSGYSSAYCIHSNSCPGSGDGWCYPYLVWSGTVNGSSTAYNYHLNSGSWYLGNNYRTDAFSVRCVAEVTSCADKISAGCEMCDGNKCLKCASGYVLKNGKCEIDCASKFGSSCTSCTASACSACASGYILSGGSCTTCSAKFGSACTNCTASACTACKSGYVLKNGVCTSCSSLFANCSTCSATSCSSCNSGYILNNGICSNCSKYGAGCTSCNSSTCLSCLSGYKLNGTICTYDCSVYDAKCVNCDNVRCNLCAAGYQLSGGKCVNTCSKFGEGCVSCSSTRCNKCALGYVLEFGACITSCQSEFGNGCVRCSSNVWGQDRECLECDGYYDEAGWCQPYNQTVPPDLQNPWW